MRTSKYLFGALIILFLAACETTAGYIKILDPWVGTQASVLVDAWGAPDGETRNPDGSKVLTYKKHETKTLVSMDGNFTIHLNCRTDIFVSPNGIIKRYEFKGNGCKA